MNEIEKIRARFACRDYGGHRNNADFILNDVGCLLNEIDRLQATIRGVDQLADRVAHNHEVAGSSPVPASNSAVNETVSMWIPTTDLMLLRRMGKLSEELGELQSVAARIVIQGLDGVEPKTSKANLVWLSEEIADVYAQLDETVSRLQLPFDEILRRRARKRLLMRKWEEMFSTDKAGISA